jgi:transposase-like protein
VQNEYKMKNTKEELFLAELGIDVNELIDCGYGAKLRLTSILNDYEKLVNKTNDTHDVSHCPVCNSDNIHQYKLHHIHCKDCKNDFDKGCD